MAKIVTPNPRHAFVEAVAKALRQRCDVAVRGAAGVEGVEGVEGVGGAGDRILVAVSGGADSVALLRALTVLAGRRGFGLGLAVGHVHHHLRPKDADEDAAFVEALAGELDLPFMCADLDLDPAEHASACVPASRKASSTNLEARARRLRYDALSTMAIAFDAPFIATAHHGDDQLETLLMRLLRGTTVTGLRGIAWRRKLSVEESHSVPTEGAAARHPLNVTLIRPMLGVTREAARAYLQSLGQPWREDYTNADVSRLRARLRHEVLPVLRDIQPDAALRAVVLADHLRQVHRLIEQQIEHWHEHVLTGDEDSAVLLDRGEARLMSPVVLGGLLRRILADAGVPRDRLTQRTLSPILRAIRDTRGGERRFDLAGGVAVRITRDMVLVEG